MRKTFTLLIALMALCATSWATPTTITWNAGNGLTSIDVYSRDGSPATSSQRLEGITLTGTTSVTDDYAGFYTYDGRTDLSVSNGGTLTFSSALYLIHSIVINFDGDNSGYGYASSPTEWESINATLTWSGEATHSVELANAYGTKITSIEFTVEAVPTTTVTWDQTDIETILLSCSTNGETQTASEIKGIIASLTRTSGPVDEYDRCQFTNREPWISNSGELTFTSSVGDIVGIVITCDQAWSYYDLSTGWTYDGDAKTYTWEGMPSSQVAFSGSIDFTATSIAFTMDASAPAPASTTITWDQTDAQSVNVVTMNGDDPVSKKIKGITVTSSSPASGDYCVFTTYDTDATISMHDGGTLTFAPESGRLTGIVITCNAYVDAEHLPEGTGWSWNNGTQKLTWTGDAAASVSLMNDGTSNQIYFAGITSIAFTVVEEEPAPAVTTTTITWDQTDVASLSLAPSDIDDVATSEEIDGITASLRRIASGDNCEFKNSDLWISNNSGTLTFTSSVGDISGIVLYASGTPYTEPYNLPTDWTWDSEAKTLTWAGTAAAAVTLSGSMDFIVSSIEFTVVTAAAPVDPTPSSSTITWDYDDLSTISIYRRDGEGYVAPSATVKTITAITDAPAYGDYCHLYHDEYGSSISVQKGGSLTFSLESGNFTRIVIDCGSYPSNPSNVSEGWVWDATEYQLIWSGTAASSVTLECNNKTGGESYDIYFNIYSIEFTVSSDAAPVDPTPSGENFTWAARQVNHVSLWCTSEGDSQTTPVIKNIITSLTKTTNIYGNCYFEDGELGISNCGELKFKSIVGDLTRIVITCSSVTSASDLSGVWQYNSGAGTLTWAGVSAAEEVALSGNILCDIASIEFTYIPAEAEHMDEEFQDSRHLTYRITGAHTAKLIPQASLGSIVILDSYEYMDETYYITEIDDYAFYNYHDNNVEIANIQGGANIAKIGAHAFENCYQLYDAMLGSVIDEIGDAAFKDCKLLHAVECYTDVPPVLGSNVFAGNTYMNHINVHSSVVNTYKAATGWSAYSTKIGAINSDPAVGEKFVWHNQTTDGVYQVTSTSPKEAKVLPYPAEISALFPITYEGTLVIPEEVNYIHNSYAVTGIGANAYKDSTRFNMVLMPEAMKTIESGAFRNCTGVEKVFFLWDDPTTVTWADANQGLDFKTAASGETKIFVPQGRLAAYQAWAPAWASCMVEGELFDVTASVDPVYNIRYYRTFYSSTTDYMMPPSVWAHAGYVDGDAFILNPVAFDGEILPRGTAVVLESETPTYRLIPVGNDAPLYDGPNDLIGTDVAIPRTSVGNNGENVYVLGKQATINGHSQVGMGMYRYTGEYLGAHKAYMIYSGSGSSSSSQQHAPVRFLFRPETHETPTSLETVQESNLQCTKIIRDGQLIIIKDGKEYSAQGIIIK